MKDFDARVILGMGVILVLWIIFGITVPATPASALTCSYSGDQCPSAEACSIHCRQLGRAGGQCKWSPLENRCICYCYRGDGHKTYEERRTKAGTEIDSTAPIKSTLIDSDVLDDSFAKMYSICKACTNETIMSGACFECVHANLSEYDGHNIYGSNFGERLQMSLVQTKCYNDCSYNSDVRNHNKCLECLGNRWQVLCHQYGNCDALKGWFDQRITADDGNCCAAANGGCCWGSSKCSICCSSGQAAVCDCVDCFRSGKCDCESCSSCAQCRCE